MEHKLQPIVMYFIMPPFALANAGVELPTQIGAALISPVTLGVGFGLLIGKPLGILAISWLLVRFGWAELGTSVTWRHMIGAAFLAGIGFTMSLFVNGLAFNDPLFRQEAKSGILIASLIAGTVGYLLLRRAPKDRD